MIEGIIQKVFEKYRLRPTFEIEDMKQELIAEIKKVHSQGGCDITCGGIDQCRFLEELIGEQD